MYFMTVRRTQQYIAQVVLCSFDDCDFVARQTARFLGASSGDVIVDLRLYVGQASRNTAQLHFELVAEFFHLDSTQFAVNDARQKADDAPPLVVLSVQPLPR